MKFGELNEQPDAKSSLQEAFGHFPTGGGGHRCGGRRSAAGLATIAFVPVSLEPPLVSFCAEHLDGLAHTPACRCWASACSARPMTPQCALAAKLGTGSCLETVSNDAGAVAIKNAACGSSAIEQLVPAGRSPS